MDPQYNPQENEKDIYELWEKGGFFNPDNAKGDKDPFCIIMPPPNANGNIHLGHAVFISLEDIMIRYNRMLGRPSLWLPGVDHAGFETQVVFEKELAKQDKNRFDFSRDELYQMMWNFVQEKKKATEDGLKKLGASCDWSREKFTLDPDIVKTVYGTFKKLHEDGLVYRGKRIVNWCAKHQTSLSDLEISYEERQDKLTYIKYPLASASGHIVVATTRPETMLGDTAVAVNPSDERYKQYIGQKILLPIQNREIPIVADEAIDPNFGTGAVKVTPAHDAADFDIAGRQNLPAIELIDKRGRLTEAAGAEFSGLKAQEARTKVVEKLKELGLLEKEEDYKHSVALCYKCGGVIEPLISEQWFVKIKSLAEKAMDAVKAGETKFHPERFEKLFFNWMENIRDWNISRQIVWGIRIPVWYCNEKSSDSPAAAGSPPPVPPFVKGVPDGRGILQKEELKSCYVISDEKPAKCEKCGATDFMPESDTFDTWFSSGQWPFAALQNNKPGDLEKFYPTSVMETGWDIIFFWVARMMMLCIYLTGKTPFADVVLHGMVRDKERQKMSKSKGNVIDPLKMAETYGSDALRMSLVFNTSAGSDIILGEDKVVAQKRFANKLWNAARFVFASLGEDFSPENIKPEYNQQDELIISQKEEAAKKITENLNAFQFHEAAQEIYHFFWHSFCDRYIEESKARIKESQSEEDKNTARYVLWKVLLDSLKLLHPFMPFITESIYQKMPGRPRPALIAEKWPVEK